MTLSLTPTTAATWLKTHLTDRPVALFAGPAKPRKRPAAEGEEKVKKPRKRKAKPAGADQLGFAQFHDYGFPGGMEPGGMEPNGEWQDTTMNDDSLSVRQEGPAKYMDFKDPPPRNADIPVRPPADKPLSQEQMLSILNGLPDPGPQGPPPPPPPKKRRKRQEPSEKAPRRPPKASADNHAAPAMSPSSSRQDLVNGHDTVPAPGPSSHDTEPAPGPLPLAGPSHLLDDEVQRKRKPKPTASLGDGAPREGPAAKAALLLGLKWDAAAGKWSS